MVYYLYTDKHGVPLKLAAVVIGVDDDGIAIRVGRYDVHSKEVSTLRIGRCSRVIAAALGALQLRRRFTQPALNRRASARCSRP